MKKGKRIDLGISEGIIDKTVREWWCHGVPSQTWDADGNEKTVLMFSLGHSDGYLGVGIDINEAEQIAKMLMNFVKTKRK